LLNVDGTFYGVTRYGGTDNDGTVFSITPGGREKVLYNFTGGNDALYPSVSLVDFDGTLYGTATGGANGNGTLFSVTTGGTETVLHTFGSGSDGTYPNGLTVADGKIFGTTFEGGGANSNGFGTVFRFTPPATESILHRFVGAAANGRYPDAAVIDVDGTLYGTAETGGAYYRGLVYSITL
jgi:uncharacterized repeat protein (TIGR03803 family)